MTAIYLKLLMTSKGLNQRELSKYTDMPQCRLSLLCNGKTKATKAEREKLEKWFPGISADLLLGEIDE
jgi:transcriptional regulator with XRE-family HTH domain